MKKKIMSILLAAVLSLTTITGCGSDETTNHVSRETTQESEAKPTEAPTAEPTEAPAAEPTEAPAAEPAEAPTAEPAEAPTAEPATESSQQNTDGTGEIDWSAAYEGYFEREDIISENISMNMNVSQDGITFGLEMATADGNTYMNFDFGTVALDMYVDAEKVYTCTRMEGQETWNYAFITTEEDMDSLMSMGEAAAVDTSTFSSYAYYEEVTEDGIVYDVLSGVSESDGELVEGYYYVNRETQKLSRMVVNTEAGPMAVEFGEVDSVEIPEEAQTATEVTMEDIMSTMLGAIMMGAFSAVEE